MQGDDGSMRTWMAIADHEASHNAKGVVKILLIVSFTARNFKDIFHSWT